MMQRKQLDAQTEARLEELLRTLAEDLARSSSPHLTAATVAWMEDGSTVLSGGVLRAPSKPPINVNDKKLTAAQREVLEAASEALYALIVRLNRPDASAPWQLEPVLVGREEYRSLVAARKPIDQQIEAKLRQLAQSGEWERITFGRLSAYSSDTTVNIKRPGKLERSAPPPELLALLDQTVSLYKQAGLSLLSADWTLRADELRFKDYFE